MLLTDVETALRQDLFDPALPTPRWQTSDLDRAIDKAVDRYSQFYPNIAYADMHSSPYQRTYPYPQSWNSNYPVWWLERIIYPLQVPGSAFLPPASAPTLAQISGSALNVGSYQYAVSFLTQGGETLPSPLASISLSAGNQAVQITAIPTGAGLSSPGALSINGVIGRNLYRTLAGGSALYLLTTLSDTFTTGYMDTLPDSQLASRPPVPTINTSGLMYWPPLERDFAEYSNLFDSTTALAAGGNQGSGGSPGTAATTPGALAPGFTLHLATAELPRDTSLIIRVFYATKHQLDASGSTIPEMHRDLVVLGASAYAMEAYQTPTNDNFQFQDGALHDHLDDTAIPLAWLRAIRERREQFESRLQVLKNQRDFASSARVRWGDVPVRWNRL